LNFLFVDVRRVGEADGSSSFRDCRVRRRFYEPVRSGLRADWPIVSGPHHSSHRRTLHRGLALVGEPPEAQREGDEIGLVK